MSMPYLELLAADLHNVGLLEDYVPHPGRSKGWDWGNLHDLLAHTRLPDPSVIEAAHELGADYQPATAIGKRVVNFLQTKNNLQVIADELACCPEAETKLVRGVLPFAVAREDYDSPIIVTKDEQPAAVIKGYGEATCYGLTTDYRHGLLEGAFTESTTDFKEVMRQLPRSDHAWTVPVEILEAFELLRFSVYAIPRSKLAKVAANTRDRGAKMALQVSHGEIKTQVRRLMKKAQPLPEKFLPDELLV